MRNLSSSTKSFVYGGSPPDPGQRLAILSQRLHQQPHLFVCWFFSVFFGGCCFFFLLQHTLYHHHHSGPDRIRPCVTPTTLKHSSCQQCSSPLPMSRCPSCSILITLNSYSLVVTSEALHSQARYISTRATALLFRNKSFASNQDEISFCKRPGFLEEQCETRELNPLGQKGHH